MLEVTRFKKIMLGLVFLAVREEANFIDNEAVFMPEGRDDVAVSMNVGRAPSDVQLKNYLKDHGLEINQAAFAVAKEEENNKVAPPLATPKAKAAVTTKASQAHA